MTETHNIGCYEGKGVDDGQGLGQLDTVYSRLLSVIGRIIYVYTFIFFSF